MSRKDAWTEPAGSAGPERSGVRASDAEREQVVTLLREHAAAGRLDVDELDERVAAAYAARTRADLRAPLDDLPDEPAPRETAPRRTRRASAATAFALYATVAAVLVAVWALSGAGAFWPAWFIGFGALAVLKHRRWSRPRWDRVPRSA